MRRFRALALAGVIAATGASVRAEPAPSVLKVLGTVSSSARPVADALVIALNLQDLKATQTWTTAEGNFSLPGLRSGIYKVIAVKSGFAPAITTIVPNRTDHRIALRLDSETDPKRKSVNQELWEIRGSLPPDVLRDLDLALQPVEIASYDLPRFRGEMVSLAGVTDQQASHAFAQTALGVHGRIGESWQVGIRGDLQRFEDPDDGVQFGAPVAESSAMSMELRSSPTQAYRVASTRSSWMYADEAHGSRQADVRAHNFEWERGAARVQVRYFEQENLFANAQFDSTLIEIAGDVPLLQTRRNDFGVRVRVTQESVETNETIFRTADVQAHGSVAVVPAVILHYGLASRIAADGQEFAPRTGAEWKLTRNTSIIGSMLYKVIDRDPMGVMLPAIVFWSEDDRVLPRYSYSAGLVSGRDANNRFSVIGTITAVDDPLRVVFADARSQFWDGLHIDTGDIRRDVRMAYRREIGRHIVVDVVTTAGTAVQSAPSAVEREKVYLTGDLQSTYTPTRTTLAVSYREIHQPGEGVEDEYRSERMNVRMAQSLYLPIDIKLLLGLELARAENSPYMVDTLNAEGRSKKYIGGLAFNF